MPSFDLLQFAENPAPSDVELKPLKVHILPANSSKFADAQTRGRRQQDHDPFSRFQKSNEIADLDHRQKAAPWEGENGPARGQRMPVADHGAFSSRAVMVHAWARH